VLGVSQAFLRSLDAVGAVTAQRSDGGRRLFTRRQLAFAARVRELVDPGHTLAAARRILVLEDDLAAERALTAGLRSRRASRTPVAASPACPARARRCQLAGAVAGPSAAAGWPVP
jgi:DNA-binding transcriptional MerR regulator